MAVGITHILTVLSVVHCSLKVGDWSDAATQDLLKQREEEQSREMVRLMQEMEAMSQETHGLSQAGMLLAACHSWWFWVAAETLLLLFGLYWLPRNMSAVKGGGSHQGSSGSVQDREEDNPWQDQPAVSLDKVGASTEDANPFPRTTFSPGCFHTQDLSAHKTNIIDRLLVPLRLSLGLLVPHSWALWGRAQPDPPACVSSASHRTGPASSSSLLPAA